jgi:hypothetical protein
VPTVYRYKGYRFFFYSNEGWPPELPHIHVRHGERVAKFWLNPVELASAWGMSATELNELQKVIQEQHEDLQRAWHDFFRR